MFSLLLRSSKENIHYNIYFSFKICKYFKVLRQVSDIANLQRLNKIIYLTQNVSFNGTKTKAVLLNMEESQKIKTELIIWGKLLCKDITIAMAADILLNDKETPERCNRNCFYSYCLEDYQLSEVDITRTMTNNPDKESH